MSDNSCLICNPAPENLILRSERGVVLLDDPVRVGHVLVGASVHIDGLHALPPEKAADTMALAADVARVIVEDTGAEKVYVAAVGDKDKHLHLHLIPRYQGDAGLGPYIFGGSGWIGTFGEEPALCDQGAISDHLSQLAE